MTEDDYKNEIKEAEGLRLDVYYDSMGYPTIGYGHVLNCGSTIPREAADIIFEADYDHAVYGYDRLGLDLDTVRRSVIIDMIFNLGLAGVMKFEHMLFAIKHGDWVRAANELMDSKYAKQVPNRAKRNRDKILYGENYYGRICA